MAAWKKILVAVNDGETSMKAVRYVGEMCGRADFDICLLHVSPEPPPYYYREGNTLQDYAKEKEAMAAAIFDQARQELAPFGIAGSAVETKTHIAEPAETISQSIFKVQQAGGFGTVVVGKRGVSKTEEFLFGSISNAIAQKCSGFAVWVVS